VRSSLALGNPDPPPNSDAEPSGGDERIGVAQFIGSAILPARETGVGKQRPVPTAEGHCSLMRGRRARPFAVEAIRAVGPDLPDPARKAVAVGNHGLPGSNARGIDVGRCRHMGGRSVLGGQRRKLGPGKAYKGATGKARQMVLESCLAAERLRALPMGFSTCTGVGACSEGLCGLRVSFGRPAMQIEFPDQ
jgi:hypothetical protein